MGCTSSFPGRVNSPLFGAVSRPQRGFTLSSAKSEPTQDNVGTSINHAQLPGAVLERGDAATSSRLRARPARSSMADPVQQEPSMTATGQNPADADLPNAVPELGPVTSAGAQHPAIPSKRASRAQLGDALPAAVPRQLADQSGVIPQRPGGGTPAASSVLPPARESSPAPAPESQQQQQQQPGAAAAAAAVATPSTAAAVPLVIAGEEIEQPLTGVSSAPAPVADGRKLVLVVWDLEHVRCPQGSKPGSKQPWKHPLSPQNVLGYLKQHLIYSRGRMEYRTVAALSDGTLRHILKYHENFVELAVPNLSLLLAAKGATSAVLEKEVRGFMSQHAHIARQNPGQLTIALIARDDHFADVRQEASDAGFCVEVLSQRHWVDFLRRSSGQRTVKLVKMK